MYLIFFWMICKVLSKACCSHTVLPTDLEYTKQCQEDISASVLLLGKGLQFLMINKLQGAQPEEHSKKDNGFLLKKSHRPLEQPQDSVQGPGGPNEKFPNTVFNMNPIAAQNGYLYQAMEYLTGFIGKICINFFHL